jgi:hypothetical protein
VGHRSGLLLAASQEKCPERAQRRGAGYHQLHDLWRTIGYVDIARGKTGWGAQDRRGFARPADELPSAPHERGAQLKRLRY